MIIEIECFNNYYLVLLNLMEYVLTTQFSLIYNSDVKIIVLLHQYISNKHNSEIFGISCYNLTTKNTEKG